MKAVVLALVISLSSCNSENTSSNDLSQSLVGKWYVYKNVQGNFNYTDSEICDEFPNCRTYEFKSNGTCIFFERGETTDYTYEVDGDFIKFFSPQTEELIKAYKIILLNNEELGLDQTEQINYFKRN